MTVSVAVVSALGVALFRRQRFLIGVSSALWIIGGPLLAFVGAVSLLGIRALHKARGQAGVRVAAGETEVVAVEAVAVGVAGGLSFEQAASVAAGAVGGRVAADIERGLRVSTSHSPILERSGIIPEMFAVARMSRVTGAPLADRLVDMASSIRRDHAAAARQRLSRLPVLLLFPLALLILPGFVLLAVAPAVVGGFSRLGL